MYSLVEVQEKTPLWCSARFSLAIIGFFGFVNLYAQRVNLSVAIVCMVNHSSINEQYKQNNNTRISFIHDTCASSLQQPESNIRQEDGIFTWSKQTQGLILGAFCWGYMTTQILGGLLAERYGGKRVCLWNMLLVAICTLLCPLGASYSYIWFIVLRIVMGIGEGVVYPSMHAIWSQWAPPLERSILVGFTYAGAQIGNVIAFPMSGFLCHTAGWGSVFYLFGILGLVWCFAWQLLVSDTPSKHKRITNKEKEYIENSLIGQIETTKHKKDHRIPWLAMMTSRPVWAIIISHSCCNFADHMVLTMLPTYMKEVFNFDIESNGIYSAFPYIAYFLTINLASNIADFLRRRKILSTKNVRKIMMLFAMCGQSVFLVPMGYLNCNQSHLAVTLITIAQGIVGFQYAGAIINQVDIAPKFAGTLFGISNTIATIPGIAAPYVAATLTADKTLEQWRSVFWVSASIMVFGSVFYTVFASGESQSWAVVQTDEKPEKIKFEI